MHEDSPSLEYYNILFYSSWIHNKNALCRGARVEVSLINSLSPASVLFFFFYHLTFLFTSNNFSALLMQSLFILKRSLKLWGEAGLCWKWFDWGIVQVALAPWVMDTQQRGASSLAEWLKLMGTYGAPAPLNSLEHGSHSALIYSGLCVDQ